MNPDDQSLAQAAPRRRFLKGGVALAATSLGVSRAFAAEDTIRIGYLTHRTGPFAPFAEADAFILENAGKALAGGLTVGGKKYKVEFVPATTRATRTASPTSPPS